MPRSLIAAAILLIGISPAVAVSLNGKPSDDSVCDLSPYTTSRLSQRTFVPARTPNSEEIYTRLALRFVVSACRQGQTLMLHSDDGSRLDDRYFEQLASTLCGPGAAIREASGTADEPHAFRVRCRITRLVAARAWLRDSEAAQSTEHLIANGAASPSSGRPKTTERAEDRREKCGGSMSYGALLGVSGGCRD